MTDSTHIDDGLAVNNNFPIVLVHGLIGWGPDELLGLDYWQGLDNKRGAEGVYTAEVSAVASSHDRACELFYQLVGGRVDYGAAHAKKFGHARYGREYITPMYGDWSEQNPIHLVGHSMGAPTIRMLQFLLEIRAFPGYDTNHRWIQSISTISGVNNGAPAVYVLGVDEDTGLIGNPSLVSIIVKLAQLYSALAPRKLLDIYDFDLDHWGLRRRKDESFVAFVKRILSHDGYLKGKDNPGWDLSIHGMYEWNKVLKSHEDTYYFGYSTQQTFALPISGSAFPRLGMNPLMGVVSRLAGKKRFSKPIYPNFRSEDWWQNDGLVPTYSQQYPRISGEHTADSWAKDKTMTPGVWWDMPLLDNWDHGDIVAAAQLDQLKGRRRFYGELFELLRSLKPT